MAKGGDSKLNYEFGGTTFEKDLGGNPEDIVIQIIEDAESEMKSVEAGGKRAIEQAEKDGLSPEDIAEIEKAIEQAEEKVVQEFIKLKANLEAIVINELTHNNKLKNTGKENIRKKVNEFSTEFNNYSQNVYENVIKRVNEIKDKTLTRQVADVTLEKLGERIEKEIKQEKEEIEQITDETERDKRREEFKEKDHWKEYLDSDEKDKSKAEAERDKNFKAASDEAWDKIWNELAISGKLQNDKLTKIPSLDGACSIGLLVDAGLKPRQGDKIKYIKPGEVEEGRTNIGTGGRHGVVMETINGKQTVFINRTKPESGSTTQIVFKTLDSLGLIDKNAYVDIHGKNFLEDMLKFIADAENGDYSFKRDEYEKNYSKTLWGLHDSISYENLIKFFKAGKRPDEIMEDEAKLKECGGNPLVKRSETKQAIVEESMKIMDQMEIAGYIIDTGDPYGKIAVCPDIKIAGQFDAVKAWGCDTWVVLNDKEFFIMSKNPVKVEFEQGKKSGEKKWNKNRNDEKVTITLEEILNKLTDGKFVPTGELKTDIEAERLKAVEETLGEAQERLKDFGTILDEWTERFAEDKADAVNFAADIKMNLGNALTVLANTAESKISGGQNKEDIVKVIDEVFGQAEKSLHNYERKYLADKISAIIKMANARTAR